MDKSQHLAKVRIDYVLGAKWLLRVRLLGGQNIAVPSSARQQAPPLQGRRCSVARQGRDRRQQGTGAIRCALREPADQTWVPVWPLLTPFARDLT